MFVDTVKLTVRAGKGGNGIIAWRREKFIPKGGPAGGDGGNGASVSLKASAQFYSLENFRNHRIIKADDGQQGGQSNRKGRNGKDLTLYVPLGTIVKDAQTEAILFDFTEASQEYKVSQGGRGGKGNTHFKSSTHQAPYQFTEGTAGEIKEITLELKLIADVGLVGMPNAGKSTLISTVTHLPVKIAPYPFTTLRPNLGLLAYKDHARILLADIPGIIRDAHNDRGLGLSFLKHIERTSVLLFLIDISGWEGRDPWEDFLLLRHELQAYDETLLQKPFLVVLNKIDVEGAEEHAETFRKAYPFDPATLFVISAQSGEGLKPLVHAMAELVMENKTAALPL